MKKIILSIAILFSVMLPLLAFSWEGKVEANANINGPLNELTLDQSDKLTLGFYAPLNSQNTMSLSGQAYYEFEYSMPLENTAESEISHIADLELLMFNMQIPLSGADYFSINAGRFPISDLTTLIFNQASDGIEIDYQSDLMKLKTYIGFTGFLNAHSVIMNVAENTAYLSDVYTLASPFVLANVSLQFPQLFAEQDFYAEIFGALDVGSQGNADNRMYTTFALSGPLSESWFYTFASTLGVAQSPDATWDISNLSIFEISTFLLENSILTWKTVFATSGDGSEFKSFTSTTATIDDSIVYAGYVKTGLVATYRPIDNLLLLAQPDVLLNVMDNSTKKGYGGFQWLFATRWSATSDLNLIASVGQVLLADSTDPSYLQAELKIEFLF